MISCNKIGITKNCGKELKGKIDPDEPSGQSVKAVSIWSRTIDRPLTLLLRLVSIQEIPVQFIWVTEWSDDVFYVLFYLLSIH